jgi:hypothetical protein
MVRKRTVFDTDYPTASASPWWQRIVPRKCGGQENVAKSFGDVFFVKTLAPLDVGGGLSRGDDMPRIMMPLFLFECEEISNYEFGDTGLSIEQFSDDDILRNPLFSEQDILHMKDEPGFSIVFEKENADGYKSLTNILIMSFKIFSEIRYPCIKYRICKDNPTWCRRINNPITYNRYFPRTVRPYSLSEIGAINKGFHSLIEIDRISRRTHNALYFIYRAFHSTKWMEAYILLMSSIESLFSKDKRGGATAAIATRVSSLLSNNPRCTKKNIEDLYEIRSRIIHGNIAGPDLNEAKDDEKDNLANLDKLEYVTIECFKELVNSNRYKNFIDKETRDKFMGTLNIIS